MVIVVAYVLLVIVVILVPFFLSTYFFYQRIPLLQGLSLLVFSEFPSFQKSSTSSWYQRSGVPKVMASNNVGERRLEDLDVQALQPTVATLEQILDALSLDVQQILAAVGGGRDEAPQPQ
ncbi:hypothetical protein PanWU01x14_307750 [Parasponia andersonii]|uniref:Transmembrane protein n=1 Tax=Parasponia andersonii TaxID=3476 RepID=A0A2P5AR90_PARAD|nr:hypothetical protein PanWU01x14_307750 [Parasponia andersonii]